MFKSKRFKALLTLIGCLLCTEALATIFSVAPTDRSKIYLGMVFGGNVGAIQLSGDANTTLALMFERFNYIILTVGVLVISYIGVSSTINTAREGEAMGKKMSAWVPMRAFLGTLLMVPGPTSGYSVVQMTVVWIVLNGIGAANSVWNVILNQLSRDISVVSNASAVITGNAKAATPMMNSQLDTLVQNVMMASTCMHALNNMRELSAVPGNMQQYGPVRVFVTSNSTPTVTSDESGNPTKLSLSAIVNVGINTPIPSALSSICGSFAVTSTLDKTNNQNDTFNNATITQRLAIKVAALQSMFGVVDPAAILIAQTRLSNTADLDGRFYTPPEPGYYLLAKQAYIGQITQLSQGIQMSPDASNAASWEQGIDGNDISSGTRLRGNTMAQIQSYGWIHAGSYYYDLVKASKKSINEDYTAVPVATNVPAYLEALDAKNMPLGGGWPSASGTSLNTSLTTLINGDPPNYQTKKLNAYLNRMDAYYDVDINNSSISSSAVNISTANSSGNKIIDRFINLVRKYIQDPIVENFQQRVSGDGQDPLASLHEFGWGLMLSAEVMAIYGMVLSMAISIALSSGSCMSPLAWSTQTLLLQFTPLIFGLSAMLWTGGATLNIYLPMVPYLIFTTAAFGWIIAVIEAVVGAPIVALALAHPSGEDLGKVGQPLILLANVFLRPMLMLFGFILGAGLLRAGIAMINFGFLPAINTASSPTLFSILAILMMYIFLVMAIVNKSFSLIYLLPNQIMRWIGGPTETSDPSDMIKEAKGGFDSGAKAGQAALNTGLDQSKSSVSDSVKAKNKKDSLPKPSKEG
ncbi:MAG: DotA/TraY family protein [Gammaproteobacteria bacterium]|nr:DotA/TraY family protein [Gammaproteobacteria bacterium]MBP9729031.1 DotA/TraY family protein [Gammaproteobacteria bacterium]